MQSPLLTAFDRLAEYNTVPLADLRAACGLDRAAFECELLRLRLAEVLTLSGQDRQLSQAQLDSAVVEGDDVLVNAHRR